MLSSPSKDVKIRKFLTFTEKQVINVADVAKQNLFIIIIQRINQNKKGGL